MDNEYLLYLQTIFIIIGVCIASIGVCISSIYYAEQSRYICTFCRFIRDLIQCNCFYKVINYILLIISYPCIKIINFITKIRFCFGNDFRKKLVTHFFQELSNITINALIDLDYRNMFQKLYNLLISIDTKLNNVELNNVEINLKLNNVEIKLNKILTHLNLSDSNIQNEQSHGEVDVSNYQETSSQGEQFDNFIIDTDCNNQHIPDCGVTNETDYLLSNS